MKMFPIRFEIYEEEHLLATFKGFDADSLEVAIDSKIISSED